MNKKDTGNGFYVALILGALLGFTLPMGLGANIWISMFVSLVSGCGLGMFYLWADEQ